MVDLGILQSVSYMAAALSVSIYLLNLILTNRREERNKRITLSSNIVQALSSVDDLRNVGDLLNMEWSDVEDFRMKYDSNVNPQNYAMRFSYWYKLENLGFLLKAGLVDRDLIYDAGGWMSIWIWVKFRSIIEEYRKIVWGKDAFKNMEYLTREMWRMRRERVPDFVMDSSYSSLDFEKAFSP